MPRSSRRSNEVVRQSRACMATRLAIVATKTSHSAAEATAGQATHTAAPSMPHSCSGPSAPENAIASSTTRAPLQAHKNLGVFVDQLAVQQLGVADHFLD